MLRGLLQGGFIGENGSVLTRVMPQIQHRSHGGVEHAAVGLPPLTHAEKQVHQLRLRGHGRFSRSLIDGIEVVDPLVGVVLVKDAVVAHHFAFHQLGVGFKFCLIAGIGGEDDHRIEAAEEGVTVLLIGFGAAGGAGRGQQQNGNEHAGQNAFHSGHLRVLKGQTPVGRSALVGKTGNAAYLAAS